MTVTILYYPAGNILKRMTVTLMITYLKRLVRSSDQPVTSVSVVLSRIDIRKSLFLRYIFISIQGNIAPEKLIKTMKDLKNLNSLERMHHKGEFLILSSVTISNPNRSKYFLITMSEASTLAMSKPISSFSDKSALE